MSCDAEIRPAQIADVPALSRLGERSFVDTFGTLYSAENLQKYLTQSHALEYYEKLLADTTSRCWVADAGNDLVGYLIAGLNTISTDNVSVPLAQRQCGEIKRLYMDKVTFGTGLAQRLMETGMAWLEEEKLSPILLSVFEDNLRAQKFYQRYGFSKIGEHHFPVGDQLDLDYIYWNGGSDNHIKKASANRGF